MSKPFILALDQGTTSTRAMLFDRAGQPVASASRALEQNFPRAGWVEHDPLEIYDAALAVMGEAIGAHGAASVAAIGITNQRETCLIWDRHTGAPVHNAIVWQDRRTAEACAGLKKDGHEALVAARTGLLLDPYFSASKLSWLLDTVPDARPRAARGELIAGTIDSWLIWKLTGGALHATDETNASRTMLFDIHRGVWDEDLLRLFGVPARMLPDVRACQDDFGATRPDLFGAPICITGCAGDQQAAAFGQTCFAPGTIKATFGTGCFMQVNTGTRPVASRNRLLATIASSSSAGRSYALEGSIFMAGATVQWLRDNLGIIKTAQETEALAKAADPESGVYVVPAFQGLGAPHWDARARGLICGLSRAAGRAELARAALEAVAFQTRDLIEAARADMAAAGLRAPSRLRVDGGMVANQWFLQFLADMLGLPIDRSQIAETTALGAAYHAGLAAGVWRDETALAALWRADLHFDPVMGEDERARRYAGWQAAVARAASDGPVAADND